MLEVKVNTKAAITQLEKLTNERYTEGKRRGFEAMAKIVREKARATDMFKDKTGTLRARWRIARKRRRNRDGTTEIEMLLRNTAPHAHLIIYGRKARNNGPKSKPRPFIQKAAAETGREQLAAAGRAMLDFLKEIEGENPRRA